MHEILQVYFARKEAELTQRQSEKKARLEAERREFLIQEGLFEKIYMQPGDDPEEFDCIDNTEQGCRRFKRVFFPITDEEYARIEELSGSVIHLLPFQWNPVLVLRVAAALWFVVGLLIWLSGGGFGGFLPESAVILALAEVVDRLGKQKEE